MQPRPLARAAVAVALAASALLAGCGKKKEGAPAAGSAAAGSAAPAADPNAIPAAEALAQITALADTICACPDRACAEAAREKLEADNRARAGQPRQRPTSEQADAMKAQAQRMAECVKKLP